MRTAEAVLGVIRDRGRRRLPLEDIYRQLFNRNLYLYAYGRLARNKGATTPGITPETVDGMSLAKIDAIIEALRFERYRWTPVRRTYIEKKGSTKQRPLGIPTWSDKLLQEVIRLILEAYFEPQFSEHSHGFRAGRGCHTALRAVQETWRGTAWVIEGDISQCFDSIDHAVLLATLRQKLHDNRFLRLIENLLRAGYLEDWKFNATLSGTPQGGVVSPILSNIYLDRLDQFVETMLLPAYNRGTKRRINGAYNRLVQLASYYRSTQRFVEAAALVQQAQALPSLDPQDPGYRRLRYVRYADDFLLGFCGPRAEAEEIKRRLAEFLRDTLKLELSQAKTLVTSARSEAARFLGYEVVILQEDAKRTAGKRSINGQIGLKVPADVIAAKCAPYLRRGKPVHRPERLHESPFSMVAKYQAEFRGVAQYYQLAYNVHRLNRLRWVMETSLTKTLAAKLQISVPKVYRKYRATIETPYGPYKGLQVVVERAGGRPPLVAKWGGLPLRRQKEAVLNDQPQNVWNSRTELLERLLADTCELCGSQEAVEVHHVRHLKDLQRKGRAALPEWAKWMAARHRKTLVTCRTCHEAIHAGEPRRRPRARHTTLESRVLGNVARPVRRGADGKVPTPGR